MRVSATAIKEAMRLTRDQNLAEATRVLLQSLSVGGANTRTQQSTGKHESLVAPRIESIDHVAPTGEGSMEHVRLPLGSALARLRRGELPGVSLSPGALARLGKRPKVQVREGASYLSRSFACEAGSRPYKVYVPAKLSGVKAPLVVMLHGCTQNADDFAVGTGMNGLAEEHGFIVAYPEQPISANHLGCWNWFDGAHQLRDSGEPSIIAGLTRELVSDMNLDPQRVFIAGLSAGGAMADVMSVTYPDLYAAAGIHSGLAHGVATNQASAFMAMSGNARDQQTRGGQNRTRTVIFHGASDGTVHPTNAERILMEACAAINGKHEQTTQRGLSNGLHYSRTIITDRTGVRLEYWAVEGLGHAWCGGSPEGSHTEQRGPDASREMVRFFLES
jgi:poly(hydroxyalkanoate) depolymerase family esterase